MSKFRITSDFIVNALCTVAIGTGVVEYTSTIIFNDLYVKHLKEANKYVTENHIYLSYNIYFTLDFKKYNDFSSILVTISFILH